MVDKIKQQQVRKFKIEMRGKTKHEENKIGHKKESTIKNSAKISLFE